MNNIIERENTNKEIQRLLNKLFDKTPDIKPLMQNLKAVNSNSAEENTN